MRAWPRGLGMDDWPGPALDRLRSGEAITLVTQLAVEGSTPREAGARMLVWAAGQAGTIGGGALEHQACVQARRMLAQGEAARFAVQDYPLGPLLAQCCGGRVRLMIERLGARDLGWLEEAGRLLAENRPFALRTQLTPAGPAKAVISGAEACPGAGGITINRLAAQARGPRPAFGDVIVEPAAPARPSLVLFGAGHVGRALARALAPLPFRLVWCDSRPEAAEAAGPLIRSPDALVAIAGQGADFTLVLTHDHALDYALVSAALRGAGEGFLGLIGSKTKRARFLGRLRADGFSEVALARLTCPIGLAGLRGKAPEVIAVSVAADLLLRLEACRGAVARERDLAGV